MTDLPSAGDGQVEVTYSAGDIAALNLAIWRFWASLLVIFAAFLVVVQLVFVMLDGWSFSHAVNTIDWGFTAIMVAAIGAWIALASVISYWWRSRKGLHGPIRFALADDGLNAQSRLMESRIFWTGIKSLKRQGPRLFLFITRRTALIIPKRAFGDESAFENFVTSVEDHWAKRHRL